MPQLRRLCAAAPPRHKGVGDEYPEGMDGCCNEQLAMAVSVRTGGGDRAMRDGDGTIVKAESHLTASLLERSVIQYHNRHLILLLLLY